MRYFIFSISVCILSLNGCAGLEERYSNPNATKQQFVADRQECLSQAQSIFSGMSNAFGGTARDRVAADCAVYKSCLRDRGYISDPQGSLFASSGPAIECRK
jgi:hypothetical protein